jgi:tetratricopeptide (TPR) repeat protein/class 3 adenylate cyclase
MHVLDSIHRRSGDAHHYEIIRYQNQLLRPLWIGIILVHHLPWIPNDAIRAHRWTMVTCTHRDNPPDAVTCGHCGALLGKRCPRCQEALPPHALFCLACGLALPQPDLSAPPSLSRQAGIFGERRLATILFSDLTGYTAMNETLDPEEVEGLMRRIKEGAVEIVERHGGIVNQFVGDEVVALYGITEAHEDDALRAVQSAIELHALVREMSPEIERRIAKPLLMHTGIHTGLIVTNSRDARDGRYGITGEAVITGVRLKTEAKPDDILVSRETQKLIAPFYRTEALPGMTLKGHTRATIPYRVLEPSSIRSRFEASAIKGFSRYTGRQQELQRLETCLDRTIAGQGAFVTVIGDPGIGKSRLLHEFTAGLNQSEIKILRGRCHTFAQSTPYHPFLDALRQELNLHDETKSDHLVQAVRTSILDIDPDLRPYLPYYLHLLAQHTDSIITHMQAEELRHAMVEALANVFARLAARQPTLLILEDWHWHDEPSEQLLKHLAELLPRHALSMVLTARPEYSVSWADFDHHVPLGLLPLHVEDSESIMRSVFKADLLPQGLGPLVHERTSGNPLFIEEICHSLIEDGRVTVRQGQARLTRALNDLVLPETIQSIIQSRLDRLDWKLKEVLRLASVIGRVFTVALLEKVLQGQDAGNLRESLEALIRTDMVLPVEGRSSTDYMFKHALTQQVAYSTVLHQRRKVLHGLVGRAMEELYGHRMHELVHLLHHHFSLAEDWEKAIQYAREAAQQAKRVCQFEEALRLLEQMKIAISQLPADPSKRGTLIETLLEEERICDTLGWRERQEAVIQQLFSILRGHDDPLSKAAACVRQGDLFTQLGRFEEADRALQEALVIRRGLLDKNGEGNALRSLSFLRWHQGRHQEAVACNEAALAIDRERGDGRAMSHDLTNLAPLLQHLGDPHGALERLEEALALEASQQNPFNRMTILFNIGNVYNKSGDLDRALSYYRDSLKVCVEHHLGINHTLVLCSMASIYWKQGLQAECVNLYTEVLQICRRMNYRRGLSNGLTALGNFLLLLDRADDALPYFIESTAVLEELGDYGNEAIAWRMAASIYQHSSRTFAQALEAWGKAHLLLARVGDRAGQIQVLYEMGRLARDQSGNSVQALEYFGKALALAKALGDVHRQGDLLNALGITHWKSGAYEQALLQYEAALAQYRDAGDLSETALMLNSLGVTLKSLHRYDEALARLQQAVHAAHQANHRLFLGHALAAIGDVYRAKGDSVEALVHYRRSLEIRREIGDRQGEGWMLHHLAMTQCSTGQTDHVHEWIVAASEIAQQEGDAELIEACRQLQLQRSDTQNRGGPHATLHH